MGDLIMQPTCENKYSRMTNADFLDNLVEKITTTFDDKKGINHIKGYNLPTKNEIFAILNDLLELVFPGYSGTKNYDITTIHYSIGTLLSRIYSELFQQITKVLHYNCEITDCEDCNIPEMAADATEFLLESIPKIRTIMKRDVTASYEGDPAAQSFDEIILSYPGIRAITVQRLAHALYSKKIPLIPRLMTEYAHSETGIDIHPGAKMGNGIFIDHGTGVVIGETTMIGDNVKIYQGVTLGALSFPKDESGNIIKGMKRHPSIDKNVTIYAGATILGDITIGKGSIIGGNVWITEDLPPFSKVAISKGKQVVKKK
ncbi:MAG: serine O-acetyltransferase EpsC [Verrucomicrobiota bacterium]|nr:serine O-acetyltransferase EpsC [Verrucomicrobiota bacterium]